jgi:8-oxo-dGTP diphosphatase
LIGKNPKVFNAYGDPNRDPRKHVVSVVYEVEVDDTSTLKGGDDATDAQFVGLNELINSPDKFAFDHHKILLDYINWKEDLKQYRI